MKRLLLLTLLYTLAYSAVAQELYVFSEPASNMPSKSLSAKINYRGLAETTTNQYHQRLTPEVMFGLSRKWMVHLTTSFSDFYSPSFRWESVKTYAKYRFYSDDDVHSHFRMAAFAEASYSRNPYYYQEISLDGDNSGIQAGFIATKLMRRLALSGTASVVQAWASSQEYHSAPSRPAQAAFSYSFSAGYLVFPREYTDYRQLNMNIYLETIGMKCFTGGGYMVDLAPALQFIFNSNLKLNLGARFQLAGDMQRISDRSYYVGIERVFLGALAKRKKST